MNKIDTTRFSGFSDLYDSSRPKPPFKVVEILKAYFQNEKINSVVDLASGSGLSTILWKDYAENLIGIEPTDDMRETATLRYPELKFLNASSYETGLKNDSIDLVTCSQAFHWMEPFSTINEVHRILKNNGVFAVYDCSWPVTWAWEAEKEYQLLFETVNKILKNYPELNKTDIFFDKENHFYNFKKSNKFRFCSKIFFDNVEFCDVERFIGIALSQGQIQKLIKNEITEIKEPLNHFIEVCKKQKSQQMRVCYSMYIGIK